MRTFFQLCKFNDIFQITHPCKAHLLPQWCHKRRMDIFHEYISPHNVAHKIYFPNFVKYLQRQTICSNTLQYFSKRYHDTCSKSATSSSWSFSCRYSPSSSSTYTSRSARHNGYSEALPQPNTCCGAPCL